MAPVTKNHFRLIGSPEIPAAGEMFPASKGSYVTRKPCACGRPRS